MDQAPLSRLDRVAVRISAECRDLALATDALQAEIGRWIEAGSLELDAATIRRLQETDRVSQTLGSLARLMARLSPELANVEVDRASLAAELGLESVARRLLGE